MRCCQYTDLHCKFCPSGHFKSSTWQWIFRKSVLQAAVKPRRDARRIRKFLKYHNAPQTHYTWNKVLCLFKGLGDACWHSERAFSLKQTFTGAWKDKTRGHFLQVARGLKQCNFSASVHVVFSSLWQMREQCKRAEAFTTALIQTNPSYCTPLSHNSHIPRSRSRSNYMDPSSSKQHFISWSCEIQDTLFFCLCMCSQPNRGRHNSLISMSVQFNHPASVTQACGPWMHRSRPLSCKERRL